MAPNRQWLCWCLITLAILEIVKAAFSVYSIWDASTSIATGPGGYVWVGCMNDNYYQLVRFSPENKVVSRTIEFGPGQGNKIKALSIDQDTAHIYAVAETSSGFHGQATIGRLDVVLIKYTPAGAMLWTRIFGTVQDEIVNDVKVDPILGVVYVAGYTFGDLNDLSKTSKKSYSECFMSQFSVNDGDNVHGLGQMSGNLGFIATLYTSSGYDKLIQSVLMPQGGRGVLKSAVRIGSKIFAAGSVQGTIDGQSSSGGTDCWVTLFWDPQTGNLIATGQISGPVEGVVYNGGKEGILLQIDPNTLSLITASTFRRAGTQDEEGLAMTFDQYGQLHIAAMYGTQGSVVVYDQFMWSTIPVPQPTTTTTTIIQTTSKPATTTTKTTVAMTTSTSITTKITTMTTTTTTITSSSAATSTRATTTSSTLTSIEVTSSVISINTMSTLTLAQNTSSQYAAESSVSSFQSNATTVTSAFTSPVNSSTCCQLSSSDMVTVTLQFVTSTSALNTSILERTTVTAMSSSLVISQSLQITSSFCEECHVSFALASQAKGSSTASTVQPVDDNLQPNEQPQSDTSGLTQLAAILAAIVVILIISIGLFIAIRRRQSRTTFARKVQGLYAKGDLVTTALPTDQGVASSMQTNQSTTIMQTNYALYIPAFLKYDYGIDYQILDLIAVGGTSKIFTAHVINSQLQEAVQDNQLIAKESKQLFHQMPQNQQQSFYQELSLLWKFRDVPYITKLYGYSDAVQAVMLMKYYPLGMLSDFVKGQGIAAEQFAYSDSQTVTLMRILAYTLQVIHDNQIVHCDLKPLNVLLDSVDGVSLVPILSDFGISYISDNTHLKVEAFKVSNSRGLSLMYAAPENLYNFRRGMRESRPFILRAGDMYAFAVIMYNMITRRDPWNVKR
ncbi:hypothetical protein MIR68_004492 [Amoeboaphelidium protococcarum]|nr:hypothetical protein MIR68_004492 [Amoeboaphelidium protococcarum]